MASKEPVDSPAKNAGSQSFFNLRWERNQATALQKELLEAYEQASRAWACSHAIGSRVVV
jgi:hypothetical protein